MYTYCKKNIISACYLYQILRKIVHPRQSSAIRQKLSFYNIALNLFFVSPMMTWSCFLASLKIVLGAQFLISRIDFRSTSVLIVVSWPAVNAGYKRLGYTELSSVVQWMWILPLYQISPGIHNTKGKLKKCFLYLGPFLSVENSH